MPTVPPEGEQRQPTTEQGQPRRDVALRLSWTAAAKLIGVLAVGLIASDLVLFMARPFALLFLAIVLAETLAPLVRLLSRWLPRALAVVVLYTGLILIGLGGGYLLLPVLIDQIQEVADRGPELVARGERLLDRWNAATGGRLNENIMALLERFAEQLVLSPVNIFGSLFEVLLVAFMSLYWLIAVPALGRFTLARLPEDQRSRASEIVREMGEVMGGFVRSVIIDGIIIFAIAYVGLSLIGVDYALSLAVIAGLGELIPVIGPLLVTIPIVAVALLDSTTTAVFALVFWIAVQQFETHILSPNVIHSQTNISPLMVVFAALVGSSIGGFLGALVAVPLSGAIRVLVLHLFAPYSREE